MNIICIFYGCFQYCLPLQTFQQRPPISSRETKSYKLLATTREKGKRTDRVDPARAPCPQTTTKKQRKRKRASSLVSHWQQKTGKRKKKKIGGLRSKTAANLKAPPGRWKTKIGKGKGERRTEKKKTFHYKPKFMSGIPNQNISQQAMLASQMDNLSLNQQQQQPPQQLSKTKKRRVQHAFLDFSEPQNQQFQQHDHIDPNAAASAVGLFPPQFQNNDSNNLSDFQTPPINGGAASFPPLSQFSTPITPNNIDTHQLQQQHSLVEPSKNDIVSHQHSNNSNGKDIFNINQTSIPEDLSLPAIRNYMNDVYKDKSFLSFEHVLPPLAGTQYRAIDQANSIPQFSRLSMYSIPYCEELREKSKIPLALCLRPFAEFVPDSEIPMKVPQIKIDEGKPVPRCRRCRAYLNPAMQHTGRSMICNICGFASPVPEGYASTINFDGVRDDYHIRPELHTGVVDYIVPKEYNIDENEDPLPIHRVFLIDLTHSSYNSKLVEVVCSGIRMALYKDDGTSNLPEGSKIAIMGFDTNLHFFKLSSNLQQTTVSLITDLDDPFVPFNDGIFVDPIESYNIIDLTLTTIEQNTRYVAPEPALGSAVKAASLLLKDVGGGQVITFLSTLPSYGPGALVLKKPLGMNESDFIKETFTPNNKFYQLLTTELVKNNIGLNLFVASSINVDLMNLGTMAVNTGGSVKQWLPFNVDRDEVSIIYEIKKVVENNAGYQGQLKVRCSHGLSINKYYGPFSTVNGEGAPNIPIISGDTSIVCDFNYNSKIDTKKDVHFQAALLYTSRDGIRKVRVINNIISVTQRISDVFDFADQDAIVKILLKRTTEKMQNATLAALKSSLIMQCSEIMAAYKFFIAKYNAMPNQLVLPQSLRTLPISILSILKTKVFATKLHFTDLRVDSLFKLSQYDSVKLSVYLYPLLFCIHTLSEGEFMFNEETGLTNLPSSLPLSANTLTYGGAYLIFNGEKIIIWLHSGVNTLLLQDLFGEDVDSIDKLRTYITELPKLDTYISQQVRNMCKFLSLHYSGLEKQSVEICRFRMDPNEQEFQTMFVEDKSMDLTWSYSDFLKELHKNVENKANNLTSSTTPAPDNDGENISRRFGIF